MWAMRRKLVGRLVLAAVVLVTNLVDDACSFCLSPPAPSVSRFLSPRLPMTRYGARGCLCRRKAFGMKMCEDNGRKDSGELLSGGQEGSSQGKDDPSGAVGLREVPQPPESPEQEQVVKKTEILKDLWMRNIANPADSARKRTSQFFDDFFGNLLNAGGSAAPDYYEEVLVTSIGYDTEGQGQIVEYDPAFLSRIGWFTNLKGTVFYLGPLYWQLAWLMAIATFYALFSGPAPLVLDTMGLTPAVAASKITLRLPSLKAQTFAVSLVGGLLSFLLSLFNSNGLDRWWKTRDCLGVVIGRSIDVAMMYSMYIRGYDKESDKRAQEYKKELIRYLNLAHILIYRQANSIDDLSDLESDHSYNPPRCWITKEEIKLFSAESQPGQLREAVKRRKFFAQQLEARPRVKGGKKTGLHSHPPPSKPKRSETAALGPGRGVLTRMGSTQAGPASAAGVTPAQVIHAANENRPIGSIPSPYEPPQRSMDENALAAPHASAPPPQQQQQGGGHQPLVQPIPAGGLISRYCVVYYWIEELMSKAAREGLVDRSRPEALWKMQENITKMRGAAADVFMYLYCKIPYIYVHLMTVLVKVYLIVIAAVAGSSMRMAWYLSRPADFIAAILMVFFMNLVYEGLLQIHIRLWNPLGFDINDYPQRRYQDYVWRATFQFLRKPEDILPSFMIPSGGLFAKPPLKGENISTGSTFKPFAGDDDD